MAVSCGGTSACGNPPEEPDTQEHADDEALRARRIEEFAFPDGIVAIVNGRTISEDDLALRLRELSRTDNQATRDALRSEALEGLIEDVLIEQFARQEQIEVSEAELQQRIQDVQQEYQGQDIRRILSDQDESYDVWIQAQRRALLLEKVVQAQLGDFLSVTEQDARLYYEEHQELYDHPAQIRASQILTYDKATARQALQALKEGMDFAEAARRFSESPDADQGGDLGFFEPGLMPPEFDEALLGLDIGQISEIVKTPYGYHLFKLTGGRAAQRFEFEEVKDRILSMMRRQKRIAAIDLWLSELQKNASILVNHERLQHIH